VSSHVVHGMRGVRSGELDLQRPFFISDISRRIAIMASQNLSSSALLSDSVGSIISVPGTGKTLVGAVKT